MSSLPVPSKGQPKKLYRVFTPENVKTIIAYISEGDTLVVACQRAGVRKTAVEEWISKGNTDWEDWDCGHIEHLTEYAQFSISYEKARGVATHHKMAKIEAAAEADPRNYGALLWLLERTDQNFARRQAVSVEHSGGVKISVNIVGGKDWTEPNAGNYSLTESNSDAIEAEFTEPLAIESGDDMEIQSDFD